MTDETPRRKGGRPGLPPAPQTAADVRQLISAETVKTKPRERRLRYLYRLLKAFVTAEDAARVDEQNRVQAEQNRLEQEQLELTRAEYRRRYFSAGLGLQENERLKARVAELEQRVAELEAEKKLLCEAMTMNSGVSVIEERVPNLGETEEGMV